MRKFNFKNLELPDRLNTVILFIWLIFVVLGNIFRERILIGIGTIFVIIALIRMFSKDYYKRQRENDMFFNFFKNIKISYNQRKARLKDKKNNYYRCPKCKKYMSVPKGVGKVIITCSYCKNQFIKESK